MGSKISVHALDVSDYDAALRIDRACFTEDAQWTEAEFDTCFTKCIRIRQEVVGWCSYEYQKRTVMITRIAVFPEWHRMGAGTGLVNSLKLKMRHSRRTILEVLVPEDMLEAQLFFKAQGFRARLPIIRDECGDAYYWMQWFKGGPR
jgi:ribosomal-protein-alanine N-acetyltransferase